MQRLILFFLLCRKIEKTEYMWPELVNDNDNINRVFDGVGQRWECRKPKIKDTYIQTYNSPVSENLSLSLYFST